MTYQRMRHVNECAVRYLLDLGVPVDVYDAEYCTPLHYASYAPSDIGVMRLLVSWGADVNAHNKHGDGVLELCRWGAASDALTEFFTSKGATAAPPPPPPPPYPHDYPHPHD